MTKDNRLGEYLRRTREALGLSIDELAFRSHVRPRLIGGYERGEYKPGADNLTALMAALEVQLPWASADSEESSTARELTTALRGMPLPAVDLTLVMATG